MGIGDKENGHKSKGENLKPLLKKPGQKEKKNNRVVFNENKNEFFDADYIILIREECEYDDEEDTICACNQHEFVRLSCCENNCNCKIYEELPQSPKFTPPIQFVDSVTLSPPEGYKDMDIGEQHLVALDRRGTSLCRECSLRDEEGGEEASQDLLRTVRTSPRSEAIFCEANDENISFNATSGSPVAGILKGGQLWKNQEIISFNDNKQIQIPEIVAVTPEDNSQNQRFVRFKEEEAQRWVELRHDDLDSSVRKYANEKRNGIYQNVDTTEIMLTFKIGSHILISNNSMKPNSAVRQLFPCIKSTKVSETEQGLPYIITSDSLRAIEEAKYPNLCQIKQSSGTNESNKNTVERSALRRSLIRCESKHKKSVQNTDNSLVERIKQLTCDIDEPLQDLNMMSTRLSPTGGDDPDDFEISHRINKLQETSFSPSSSSTGSSNSSISVTNKNSTDVFPRRGQALTLPQPNLCRNVPDIGGPQHNDTLESDNPKTAILKENKKRLPNVRPLTACESNVSHSDEYHYHLSNEERKKTATCNYISTEHVPNNISEDLMKKSVKSEDVTPDVLDGTQLGPKSNNDPALFVQQDFRSKKKYQSEEVHKDVDDEHDDYGFNERPSVQGVKSAYGPSTVVLQPNQNQSQLPVQSSKFTWPYYSESSLRDTNSFRKTNMNQNTSHIQYSEMPKQMNGKHNSIQFASTLLKEDKSYQLCGNQHLIRDFCTTDLNSYASVITINDGNEYCQSLPKTRYSRSLSPPPQDISKSYHQTVVYIPYNHIENYEPTISRNSYYRSQVNQNFNQNQNKGHAEPFCQQNVYHVEGQSCNPVISYNVSKATYLDSHQSAFTSRSESPFVDQFSPTKAAATPLSTCNFYRPNINPPIPIWKYGHHTIKEDHQKFPISKPKFPTYSKINTTSLTKGDIHHNGNISNEFKNVSDLNDFIPQENTPSEPTKLRYNERGVPEGADSTNSFDCTNIGQSDRTLTPTPGNCKFKSSPKPLFYSMNV